MQNTAETEDRSIQAEPREGALARVTARIAREAQVAPEQYLKETLVPKGGE